MMFAYILPEMVTELYNRTLFITTACAFCWGSPNTTQSGFYGQLNNKVTDKCFVVTAQVSYWILSAASLC